ncbi:2-hydroxyacyl-CoA lyase-like [Hevea brasiliensis]|uniref:2-hydroxyacyl-CoA lyase-like n=1 Tax=Hevea brasiliensis TaxID=3981 RepID=UPI0025CFCA32|nr:2-hydroxyacyl-CoA lyase-like [Hevea brasiliensis]
MEGRDRKKKRMQRSNGGLDGGCDGEDEGYDEEEGCVGAMSRGRRGYGFTGCGLGVWGLVGWAMGLGLVSGLGLWESKPIAKGNQVLNSEIEGAAELLRKAERPLIVFGKGVAHARAENELRKLVETTGIPFLPTPMGKGLLPDTHELAPSAARLNWLLHFGEPPKWSKDVKFILEDICKGEIELRKPHLGLVGDAKKVLELINKEIKDDPFCLAKNHPWVEAISKKAKENTPMRIIRDAILGVRSPAPILVAEGPNTMDVGRAVLIQTEPRTRLDAGTWGTMRVGLGWVIALQLQ